MNRWQMQIINEQGGYGLINADTQPRRVTLVLGDYGTLSFTVGPGEIVEFSGAKLQADSISWETVPAPTVN